jgi:rubrerythrin
MKLSKSEQIKRIKVVMDSPYIIICNKCNFKYLPMSDKAEEICPNCDEYVYDEVTNYNFD